MINLQINNEFDTWYKILLINIITLTIERNNKIINEIKNLKNDSVYTELEKHYILDSNILKKLIEVEDLQLLTNDELLDLVKLCPITAVRTCSFYANKEPLSDWAKSNRKKDLVFSTYLENHDDRFLSLPGTLNINELRNFKNTPNRTAINNCSILLVNIAKWCGCKKILINVDNYQVVILQLESLNIKLIPQYYFNNELFDLED